jgi:hypothetical protein
MSFRKSLLAATALVLCVSAASAEQKTDRPSDRIAPRWMNLGVPLHVVNGFPLAVMRDRTASTPRAPIYKNGPPKYRNAIFDNIDWKSKNEKWLRDYGFVALAEQSCYSESSHYHYCVTDNANNALPFYGTGKKAKGIGVPLFSETGSSTEYNIGIYSATASGLPGSSELAAGSATANTTGNWPLTWVDVNVKLNKGQEFFLEVSCAAGQTDCYGGWEPSVYTGADYYHYTERETYNYGTGTHSTLYSSPWHESTDSEGAGVIR